MKDKPLISVIITNYNYGRYISKAIESVLNQTYKNIELIIINDGSTDNSDEVIKALIKKNKGRNIQYVSRENKGVVYTRNEGLELTNGEYLCFLDADDYFNRSYISKSYRIAKEYDADVVYPNWHFVGEWLGRPDTNFPEFEPKLLQLQKLHVTPASLIRKSAVLNHKFETEKVAEDWDFFIGLSLEGVKFKLAKDNYINYRIRKGTRGSKNDPREDTKYFVEILEKHRKKYGNQVINPSKLVTDRHPNVVRRILTMRAPRIVLDSIRNEGVRVTTKKILAKLASRNQLVWKTLSYARNKKYQRVVKSNSIKTSPNTKLAVVVHLYYPDLWPLIKNRLASIDIPFDLFVTVQLRDNDITLDQVNKNQKVTNIIALPNRGRDVLPFLIVAKKISEEKQYEYLLKIHSKKSPHRTDGDEWLDSLLTELIPSDTTSIIKTLEKLHTGSIGPASHVVSLKRYIGGNRQRIVSLIVSSSNEKTADNIFSSLSKYPFFGGTMFWCRVDFLSPLLNSYLTPADFNTERGQLDTTTAHAVERFMGKILHKIAGKKMYVVKNGRISELPDKLYRAKYKYVD
jgi:glycosyltransferase involved in cell wall biosynthesis